jgi:phage gp36-like protein
MGNTFTTTTAATPSGPAGNYADQADLYDRGGQQNVVEYSSLDGTGTEDTAREQRALDLADAVIDGRLRMAGYVTPVPSTSRDFELLTQVAAAIALAWLYDSRGVRDDGKVDKMQVHREFYKRTLRELLTPGRLDATMSTAQPSVPQSVTV